MEDVPRHVHRSAPADRRLWLEAIPDVAATMRLHSFCLECGTVRSRVRARGRPLGYFQQALANLKAILENDRRHAKLAQVHSRLISRSFELIPDFDDPYSMSFETQWRLFSTGVRRCRPDLDEDFLAQTLPREPRTASPFFTDVLANESGRTTEPFRSRSEGSQTAMRPGN